MEERRIHFRHRVLKSGKIFLGRAVVSCAVRNVSEGGACLEVQTTFGLPSAFEFAIANQPARACKVRWMDGTRLGVQYQNASPQRPTQPPSRLAS